MRWAVMWVCGGLVACDGGCEDDEVLTAGGDCVVGTIAQAEWVTDVIDGVRTRECVAESGDGELDLVNACAYGGCVGDTYDELRTAWGLAVECSRFSSSVSGTDRLACSWDNGLGMHFDVQGNAPEPTSQGSVFTFEAPFRGTTADGLGIGVSLGCFVEALGAPREVFLDDDVAEAQARTIIIDNAAAHAMISDYTGSGDVGDGYVDNVLVFGPGAE